MDKIKRALAGPWVPPAFGKLPYLWSFSLGYMLWKYLFVPVSALELILLALTIVLFYPLYLASYWTSGRAAVLCALLACLIGTLWAPYNWGAATFFIFACSMCARIEPPRRAYLMLAGVLTLASLIFLFALPAVHIGFLLSSLTGGIPVGIAAIKDAVVRRSREQVQRKQEEVEHMARIAERERISRDLHDLLGHSLSMIALKAELAGKLVGRDDEVCRREIRDIETVARRALSEVRSAVSGYRQSGLAHALASARASLAAANVDLREDVRSFSLASAAEHVLALGLREAVTNVIRHARARSCTVTLMADDGAGLVDARAVRPGNGLTGMQERVAALGGAFAIQIDGGMALELRVPVEVAA
jgi:two-component system sensor histidine kinase DesK